MTYFTKIKDKKYNSKVIILKEKFERSKLLYIYNNKKEFRNKLVDYDVEYDPFEFIAKYLDQSNGDIKITKYMRKREFGRYTSDSGLSLQNMIKILKNTICSKYYIDIDMVCAHHTILLHLCNKYGIKCKFLKEYVENREQVLVDILNKNPFIKRGYLKIAIISMINNGFYKYNNIPKKTQWLIEFYGEIKEITYKLMKLNKFKIEKAFHKRKGLPDDKLIGTTMAWVLQDYENQILQEMILFFKKKDIIQDNFVMCHDGLLMPKNSNINDNLLNSCSLFVKERLDIKVKIIIKPMKDILNLSNMVNDSTKEIPNNIISKYDINEKYYFSDFVSKYSRKIYSFETDMVDDLIFDISKVIIIVETGDSFVIIKSDDESGIYNILKIKDINSLFNIVVLGKTYNLSKCLTCLINKLPIYRGVTNDPGNTNKKYFNVYKPILSKYHEEYNNPESYELIEPLLDFIFKIISSSDKKIYNYLLSWLKLLVCNPEIKTEVCILLYSEDYGVGKGTLSEFLSEFVIGHHKTWNTSGFQKVLGQFNSKIENSRLINISEASSKRDNYYINNESFKNLITEYRITTEAKFKNAYDIKNLANFILTLNVDDGLIIKKGDRRFCCIEVNNSKMQNRSYFGELRKKCFNKKCGNIFNTYLKNFKTNIDPSAPIMTKLKKEIILSNSPNYERFLNDYLYKYDKTTKIRTNEFYTLYVIFCQQNNYGKPLSFSKFGRRIKKKNVSRKQLTIDKIRAYYYLLDNL